MIFDKAGKFNNINFNLNGMRLECVSRYKYLGVYFCLSGSFTYAQEDLYIIINRQKLISNSQKNFYH